MHLDAIILFSARAGEVVRFYRAIGLPLEDERHGDGPLHWACELGPVHLAIYAAEGGEAPGRREGGATQLGFQVGGDLEAAVTAGTGAGGALLQAVEEVPWGRRALLADPDGRPVELNQR